MAFDLGEMLKDVPKLDTARDQIEYIRLDLIDEDPNNFYQLSGVEDLAANIELCGLQQPIRVRPISEQPGRYMIVSGHRRRKALEMLLKDDPERWGEAPCIVQQDTVSPALQQLQLIYANSNTRTMTPFEISEQAVQVEKLLYQLKEEGYEFPGRMRDHVAQAVSASKSKLARLKVIRDNLASCWQTAWEKSDISESTAYALAQNPAAWQVILHDVHGKHPKGLCESDVREYVRRFASLEKLKCGHGYGKRCVNIGNMMYASCKDRWTESCRKGCCFDCVSLVTCKKSCVYADAKKKEIKTTAKEAEIRAEAEQARRELPKLELIRKIYQRVGEAREVNRVSVQTLVESQGKVYGVNDEEKQKDLEAGTAKISTSTYLPFGYCFDVSQAQKMIDVADALGCSIDYLMGRTDCPDIMAGPALDQHSDDKVPEFIPGAWYPVSVEPPVGVPLILIDSGGFVDTGKYIGCGEYTMDYGDPVTLWGLMPEEKDVSNSVPITGGWRTGNPEAYGTYAAYVKIAGASKPMLYELLWDGEEWFHRGSPLIEDVTVACWAEQPEL